MPEFETKRLPDEPDVVTPDGSDVRILLGLKGNGMAHFERGPGQTARAVTHRTVEEMWFFISGRANAGDGVAETVDVFAGECVTNPASSDKTSAGQSRNGGRSNAHSIRES